jgi:uncharacterized protein
MLISGRLVVSGRVWMDARLRCSRCGESFSRRLDDPSFACCRETVTIGESVDLTEDIREAILLAFPSHPVCSEGCLGLCYLCGKNLNRGTCACKPPVDDRWAALNGFTAAPASAKRKRGGGVSPRSRYGASGPGRQH